MFSKHMYIYKKKKEILIYHTKQVQAVALHFSYSIITIHTHIWYKRELNRTNQSLFLV